ncbi:MAG: 4'-phosphopantetheinyl transferase superfamily protein [Gammaproteobacteria bacterium]|nr:4'-phosphopantetheinyl transferase superfamily protein [Gammaproteobacteria bacterium]
MNKRAPFHQVEENRPVVLAADTAHVWTCWLKERLPQLQTLSELLAPDEMKRTQQFRFDRDRHAYIISRATLRQLLACYLPQSAPALVFDYGEQGKPMIAGLEFNLSHSHDCLVVAITRDTAVGIDVEWVERTTMSDRLAANCFSQQELEQFHSLSEQEKPHAFFNGWTRKEAFVKALGSGLHFDLKKFSVMLLPQQPPQLLAIESDSMVASSWQLHSFVPAPSYCGAIAWQGGEKEIIFKSLTEGLQS